MSDALPGLRFETVSPSTVLLPGQTGDYDPVAKTIGSGGARVLVGVGGACHGHREVSDLVFDHGFARFPKPYPDNFPSCSLLVIYHASVIAQAARKHPEGTPWKLITRNDPGFDSCLGLYLVKRILEQPELAERWAARVPGDEALIPPPAFWSSASRGKPVFRWRHAEIDPVDRDPLDRNRRALLQLALVASHVEKNEPMAAPPDRSVHHLFLAARLRKRFLGPDASTFFRIMETRAMEGGFQPLIDGVPDDDDDFGPEIRVLDRQRELYRRDLQRARKAILFLARGETPLEDWLKNRKNGVKSGSIGVPVEFTRRRVPVDGLFLRDPQCLFFRWFARVDREASPLGRGFLFLGLAQSFARRADSPRPNRSRYRFSIEVDWARAHNAHLLDVWALLQNKEITRAAGLNPKPEEESGLGSQVASAWSDGSGRMGALVESPVQGTSLNEGTRADMTDDEAALLVWDHLTSRGFAGETPEFHKFVWTDSRGESLPSSGGPFQGGFDFVRIHRRRFDLETDLRRDPIDAQIAERLWEWIQPLGTRGIPDDFSERHLIHRGEWVAVWNRQGIAIAHSDSPDTNAWVDRLQLELQELARLTGEIRTLLHDDHVRGEPGLESVEKKLNRGTEALARLAELHLKAQAGQSPILRPFMEANGIMELASMVESMNRIRIQEKVEAQERRRDDRLQQTVAVASGIAILLAWLQMERVALMGGDGSFGLMEGNPRAWAETIGGGVVVAFFLVWAFRRIKR